MQKVIHIDSCMNVNVLVLFVAFNYVLLDTCKTPYPFGIAIKA